MGAAPTANTFGLYITTLKESTKTFDEATEAVKIFHRAKSEGVEPSSFLYNALIGKLGKARRIDDCLFYFAEMRSLGIRPTSVTYGTIVNAFAVSAMRSLLRSCSRRWSRCPTTRLALHPTTA
jgi:pentatricopeptide repeat protein